MDLNSCGLICGGMATPPLAWDRQRGFELLMVVSLIRSANSIVDLNVT